MAKETVTSGDVARRANVSQSAVSRTFTPGASVSDTTRQRVLAAADELGYRPNALARAMISGRSHLVAVLVAYLDNHFYPIVLEQLSRALQDRGYQVLLFMTGPGNQDGMVQKMLQYQVDGIVMASADMSSTLARECAQTGIPVVLFNRYVPGLPVSSVTSDNIAGGRAVAHFLVAGGHERIAFIAGAESSSTNRDRETGFMTALAALGRRVCRRVVGGYTFAGAAEAARDLFSGGPAPDAIFVANDHMAFSVIDVIRDELGLRVPEDVSVVGYDDAPEGAWGGYKLTTVKQPGDLMIAETVRILVDQLDSGRIVNEERVVPGHLVVRASTRPPDPAALAALAALDPPSGAP